MPKFRAWDNDCKAIREYDELKGLTLDALGASDFELEQYTGLKDANGKEIYEGDIIKSRPNNPTLELSKVGVVTRSRIDLKWCYESGNLEYNIWASGRYRTYEVIGNVHTDNLEEVE